MDLKFYILFASILCLNLLQVIENASSNEALIECDNVHQIEMHNLPNAIASYSNSKCALVCAIGNETLPVEILNQGKSCPEDTAGICHNGQCIGGVEHALSVCSVEHSFDFHTLKDHQGTAFTNDQCMLKCVIGGKEWSANHLHEGSPCPVNPNGVCRSGVCVIQSNNLGTTVTQKPTTTPTLPATVSKPSIDSFSASKIKLLNISLESTNPPLKPDEHISIYFYPTSSHSDFDLICRLFGSSTQANLYFPKVISDIPSKLNKASQMEIGLYEESGNQLAEKYVDLYSLFTSFYQNHQIAFGEKENFDSYFLIHQLGRPNEKIMEVKLHFTIMFSKD